MAVYVREIRVSGCVAYVPLTRGRVAIIDSEDVHLAAPYNWTSNVTKGHTYAMRTLPRGDGPRGGEMLHRRIFNAPPDMLVDHISGNTLDCRKSNLRLATNMQNQYNAAIRSDNTTGYKGVHFNKTSWCASITSNGKRRYLGSFKTPEEAHEAYIKAAHRFHGEFARVQ